MKANGKERPRLGLHSTSLLGSVFLLLAFFSWYSWLHSQVSVDFRVNAAKPGRFQVFHDRSGRFMESNSDWIELKNTEPVTVSIPMRGDEASELRIDPPPGNALRVCRLGIGDDRRGMGAIVGNLQEARAVVVDPECLDIGASADARDPQIALRLTGVSAARSKQAGWWRSTFLVSLLLTCLMPLLVGRAWTGTATGRRWARVSGICARWLDRRAHVIAAILMLLSGACYSMLTPPGGVADEEAHMSKIVRVASGMPFGDSGTRPLPDIIRALGPFRDYPHNKGSFSGLQVDQVVSRPLDCRPGNSALPSSANGYPPLAYLLPAIAFEATCIAHGSFGSFLYAARFINLAIAVFLVAWGIRTASFGKWGLVMVSLLPMTMFQIASISADSLTLALSLAWIGLLSGIAGGRDDPLRVKTWLYVLSLALAFAKPGAVWILAGLLFCMRSFQASGIPFRRAACNWLLLPGILHCVMLWQAAGHAAVREGVDAAANRAVLAQQPLEFIKLMAGTFSGDSMIRIWHSMIGVLGWLDVVLPDWCYSLAVVGLLAAPWMNGRIRLPAMRTRILAATFALVSIVGVAVPLFLYWTLPTAVTIEGIQGRYLLVSLAFALTWCAFRTPGSVRGLGTGGLLAIAILLNASAITQLYESYYVVGRPG